MKHFLVPKQISNTLSDFRQKLRALLAIPNENLSHI
jgi:hypothetical protein